MTRCFVYIAEGSNILMYKAFLFLTWWFLIKRSCRNNFTNSSLSIEQVFTFHANSKNNCGEIAANFVYSLVTSYSP